ncbi:MAG: DNA methyltransferase [Candidatus Hodarchaeales archaeon]|jgi:DNA modification methylase
MPQNSLKDYQEDRLERGVYDQRNKLNDLTGKEWLFSTKTIIPKVYSNDFPPSFHDHNLRPLPIALSQELIETFSKPISTILDPFAGFGSTLLAGYYANANSNSSDRTIFGFSEEISKLGNFTKVLDNLKIVNLGKITYDTFDHLRYVPDNSVNFILTDLLNQKIADVQYKDPKSSDTLKTWVSETTSKLSASFTKLAENGYMVIAIPFLSNTKTNESTTLHEWNFALTKLITSQLHSEGMILKSERIWFEPSDSKEEITLITPRRRLLVFRKESLGKENIRPILPSNLDQLPSGPTLMLHRSFPPSFEHKLRGQHGGMKPPELIEYVIRRYSQNETDLILDPFVGVGGTLLGATLAHRKSVGIDINTQWQTVYQEVCRRMALPEQTYIVGDSTQIINELLDDESVGMIMTDVPYWAMDKLTKTRGRFSKAGEESKEKLHSSLKQFDQAKILTIQEWHTLLEQVFRDCYKKLIKGSVLAVFIGNMYRTLTEQQPERTIKVGRFLLLASSLAEILMALGYRFREEIVWYAPDKALHIFGYPYSYIPSVVHQSILIFEK